MRIELAPKASSRLISVLDGRLGTQLLPKPVAPDVPTLAGGGGTLVPKCLGVGTASPSLGCATG